MSLVTSRSGQFQLILEELNSGTVAAIEDIFDEILLEGEPKAEY